MEQSNDQKPTQTTMLPEAQSETNKPVSVLRDGNLKATTWRNEGENGPHYSTTFSRSWKDESGEYQDSRSFSGSELLRISELAKEAYGDVREFRRGHALNPTPDQTPQEIERDQRQYGTRRKHFNEKRQGGDSTNRRARKRT